MSTSHHRLSCDVVVAGGGMAGVCAAIAAARHGAQVVLIQDRPVLGGNASSEVRLHILGADISGSRPHARESGIIEAIRLDDAVRNPQRSTSMFDLLLWEYVRNEKNIQLLLNTHLDGVKMTSPTRIAEAHATRPSTEDEFDIEATLFIDCTGDGRLGAEAGAEYRVGREGRDEFGESYAPEKPDRKVLGSSILFMAREYDHPIPFHAPAWARKFTEEDLRYRPHVPFDWGFWWVEWGGDLDTIKDNERIRDELWAIALGVWDHIKNDGDHGADNWALEWIGMIPGKRESRRFVGDYMLIQQDLENSTLFPDRVAYGGWPIDYHPPSGIDQPDEHPCTQIQVPLYSIPLRSLYSRNIENMMMAGRNISASHIAFASTRVMATGAVMGQAVGTAAAICARDRVTPRELAASSDRTQELQQTLLKDDAYILQLPANDPADLASNASVTASSYQRESPPQMVLSGVTRQVGNVTHQWASDPEQPLPQWLQLDLPGPALIDEIHLTFDSGFARPLTLTYVKWVNEHMIRGPQPETVRDYTIEVHSGGTWKRVVDAQGNYQRKIVHRFEPVTADGVRLTVHATNGDTSARVFEVRVYGPR
ncbi:MAG: FAD-dependent oxidoreductase [Anaerolineae bacterium]|nr:FAD-dependent oxidoreductase [Anaerolineae bacterium]